MNFNHLWGFRRRLLLEKVCTQQESLTGGRGGDANHPHAVVQEPSNKDLAVASQYDNWKHKSRHVVSLFRLENGNKKSSWSLCSMLRRHTDSSPLFGLSQLLFGVLEDSFTYRVETQSVHIKAPARHFGKSSADPACIRLECAAPRW